MGRLVVIIGCIGAACLVCPGSVYAQEAGGLSTFDEFRDQGLLYQRKKRTKLAMRFLNQAYQKPGGKQDFKTVYSRGVVAQELLLIELAYQMAEEAKKLVGDQKRARRKLTVFRTGLDELYGALQLEPAKNETNRRGRIFVESETGILNRKKRQMFQSIRERFRATEIEIPARIYLPHGRFTANNVPVEIRPREVATAKVYLQVDRAARPVATGGVNGWWVTGVGAAAAIASGVGAYFLFTDQSPKRVHVYNPVSVRP